MCNGEKKKMDILFAVLADVLSVSKELFLLRSQVSVFTSWFWPVVECTTTADKCYFIAAKREAGTPVLSTLPTSLESLLSMSGINAMKDGCWHTTFATSTSLESINPTPK